MGSGRKKLLAPAAADAAPEEHPERRILLIEDEAEVAEMLACEGYTAVPEPDGEQGLARFQAQPFDIVVTDLTMPGISGWDVADRIKKLDQAVPVIMLTGWDAELEPDEITARGVDRYIKKPFTLHDIIGAIDDLCGAR